MEDLDSLKDDVLNELNIEEPNDSEPNELVVTPGELVVVVPEECKDDSSKFFEESIEVLTSILDRWLELNDFRYVRDLEKLIDAFRSGYRLKSIILLSELNYRLKDETILPRHDVSILLALGNLDFTKSLRV